MIRVLGLGNVLMSDDGFGPYVARVLEAFYEFPDDVEVIDVGTPGLDLTPYLGALPKLDDIYVPGAKLMQGLASNQGVCIVFCPAGPVMEYMPDKVKQVPTTAEELLAWAKANQAGAPSPKPAA